MKPNGPMSFGLRCRLALLALLALLGASLLGSPAMTLAAETDAPPKRIGIIGAGKIGGALAAHWTKAGYEVMISSRHPDELKPLAKTLGSKASVGTPRDAAVFGDVVLISIPYGAMPQLGKDLAKELAGKIVLDTGNPYPQRDGDMAKDARLRGTGVTSKEFLPGTRLVRAFNAINAGDLRDKANRPGERVAIPLAGDDQKALAVAQRLVTDAGFDPVVVGPLSAAKRFDFGTDVYVQVMSAKELRQRLGLQ